LVLRESSAAFYSVLPADQLPHELTGMEVNMRPVGCVGGAIWRVMERSCTEIEGGNVSYTPDMS
jgi:hypothetical protein